MTPALLASALLMFLTLSYASLCAASPFGNCRKCRGWGFAMKTDRKGRAKRGKDCRRCKATGKRIRIGRHLYNAAARLHRDGTR
ncbi:hypothetical protein PV749_12075 [Streptomyces sp. ID03-2B]|uniref:hypothetical protein n=1 Tax=Streptomyces TaxID=1883 RepID=UPI001C60546E|nr:MULTISPECIES: hypothetical protein [Streptomyces]MDX3591860.1 hypothetical protein [Streptomyces sp. ID03-2B]QYA95324.1 hypothetical protein KZO11_17515 [Streptomyces anulatus]